MDLYQIKHFVAVVEGGGFTKGAERVAVSQPAISASIAKLEAELNVKLLERAALASGANPGRDASARNGQDNPADMQCREIGGQSDSQS